MTVSHSHRPSPLGRLAFAWAVAIAAVLAPGSAAHAQAPSAAQYRAFWVDTFNTKLGSVDEVTTVVTRARQAHTNVLLVQVRRRGDAWFVRGVEPLPDGVAIDRGFDPLAEIIAQAHAANIQVHAFVVVGAIWNSLTAPSHPQHVFNLHGLNPSTGRPYTGRDNWLTRTTLADGAVTSVGGFRFGSDFWIDLGHPDAAAYTHDVLMTLAENYDIDGLHLDRIRYPEISASGQSQAAGAPVGYNETALERYARRFGLPAVVVPDAADSRWSVWRREQVTAFVRRLRIDLAAVRPRVTFSAALLANGAAPASPGAWADTEASWRVFQDWQSWMRDGLLDIAVPMVYRTQHTASGADAFGRWSSFVADLAGDRHAVVGLGAYQNSLEGTLAQARLALRGGNEGVALFSLAAHNAPVIDNPLSVPAGRDTPLRSFDDLVAALTQGKSASGQWLEDPASFSGGLFALDVPVPQMPWKTSPTTGFLRGILRGSDGSAVDGASVDITAEDGRSVSTTSDGSGYYGAARLDPGTYRVTVTPVGSGAARSLCSVRIDAGSVSTLDLDVNGGVSAACAAASTIERRR